MAHTSSTGQATAPSAIRRATSLAASRGAKNPAGKGTIPNITPSHDGIGDWSNADIVDLLENGNLPDGDVVGGAMAAVQENVAKLTDEDRKAIAAYLKALPPRPNAVPKSEQTKDEDRPESAGEGGNGQQEHDTRSE